MNGTDFTKAVERARARCAETAQTYCVIEIDKDDGREVTICKQDYENDPEFEAFDGAVLAEVYFDGTVQTHYVRSYADEQIPRRLHRPSERTGEARPDHHQETVRSTR